MAQQSSRNLDPTALSPLRTFAARTRGSHAKAGRIISEELDRLGWGEGDLVSRRKRDPSELEIGLRLHRQTTLSVKEIATRLRLATPASASVVLLAAMRRPRPESLSAGRIEL